MIQIDKKKQNEIDKKKQNEEFNTKYYDRNPRDQTNERNLANIKKKLCVANMKEI